MSEKTFRALVVEKTNQNSFIRGIKDLRINDLPEGEVLIRVHYSSLNFCKTENLSFHSAL